MSLSKYHTHDISDSNLGASVADTLEALGKLIADMGPTKEFAARWINHMKTTRQPSGAPIDPVYSWRSHIGHYLDAYAKQFRGISYGIYDLIHRNSHMLVRLTVEVMRYFPAATDYAAYVSDECCRRLRAYWDECQGRGAHRTNAGDEDEDPGIRWQNMERAANAHLAQAVKASPMLQEITRYMGDNIDNTITDMHDDPVEYVVEASMLDAERKALQVLKSREVVKSVEQERNEAMQVVVNGSIKISRVELLEKLNAQIEVLDAAIKKAESEIEATVREQVIPQLLTQLKNQVVQPAVRIAFYNLEDARNRLTFMREYAATIDIGAEGALELPTGTVMALLRPYELVKTATVGTWTLKAC